MEDNHNIGGTTYQDANGNILTKEEFEKISKGQPAGNSGETASFGKSAGKTKEVTEKC